MNKKIVLGINLIIALFLACANHNYTDVKVIEGNKTLEITKNTNSEMINAALVLEGGSLRSIYTSGVLDVFMENNIEFSFVIGVSAGALNAANYIPKHIGRSAKINILHSNDSNYYGIKQFLFKGSAFNFNYLFYSPIKDLYPYDENMFMTSKQRFLIGATDCETGKTVYFEKHNYKDLVQVLQASSSIPLLCKTVNIDDKIYLDGSISDPIGIRKAFSEGFDKQVIILTKSFGNNKTAWTKFPRFLSRIRYRKYPEVIKLLDNYSTLYNSLMEEINTMENENKAFVIRPSREVKIKTIERDARRLIDFYFLGREDALKSLPKMYEYLNQ